METKTDLEQRERKLLRFIADTKWSEGFKCRNCSCKEYYEIKDTPARKCRNKDCKRTESPTANTLFEGMRLPLTTVEQIIISMHENILEVHEEEEGDAE